MCSHLHILAERGGGANVSPACADNHNFDLKYMSAYLSNDNRLENLWMRLQVAQVAAY